MEELNKYISKQYRNGTTNISVAATPTHIFISISCHNINFDNFWGGEWISKWQLDLSSLALSGSVNIHNHYFESGNIQFNLKKEFPEVPVEMQAAAIVKHIAKMEEEVTFALTALVPKQPR